MVTQQALWKGIGITIAVCVCIKVFVVLWISDSLCDAARQGNYEGVKAWLTRGASANSFEVGTSDTALSDAVVCNSRQTVDLLLSRGANVNGRGRRGYTALMFAAENGYPDIVSDLLAAGADVDAVEQHDGKTALILAAVHGHLKSATLLIAHHANVNLADMDGMTALAAASRSNGDASREMTQLLQQAGAKM